MIGRGGGVDEDVDGPVGFDVPRRVGRPEGQGVGPVVLAGRTHRHDDLGALRPAGGPVELVLGLGFATEHARTRIVRREHHGDGTVVPAVRADHLRRRRCVVDVHGEVPRLAPTRLPPLLVPPPHQTSWVATPRTWKYQVPSPTPVYVTGGSTPAGNLGAGVVGLPSSTNE